MPTYLHGKVVFLKFFPSSLSNPEAYFWTLLGEEVEGSGCIAQVARGAQKNTSTSHSFRNLETTISNYVEFKGWIAYCKEHHEANCNNEPRGSVDRIRLIDCLSIPPRLVNAQPTSQYFGLSYVWGKDNNEEPPWTFPALPMRLPLVVEDAIQVTIALGGRYL